MNVEKYRAVWSTGFCQPDPRDDDQKKNYSNASDF